MKNNALESLAMSGNKITISVAEYARLKDIETRFVILREETLHATYIPIHHRIILGIENECKQEQEKT